MEINAQVVHTNVHFWIKYRLRIRGVKPMGGGFFAASPALRGSTACPRVQMILSHSNLIYSVSHAELLPLVLAPFVWRRLIFDAFQLKWRISGMLRSHKMGSWHVWCLQCRLLLLSSIIFWNCNLLYFIFLLGFVCFEGKLSWAIDVFLIEAIRKRSICADSTLNNRRLHLLHLQTWILKRNLHYRCFLFWNFYILLNDLSTLIVILWKSAPL